VHAAEGALVLVALLLAFAFAVGGFFVGRETGNGGGGATTTETGASAAITGNAEAGAEVFASSGCGGCHTLAAAGATGNVGPSLDVSKPTEALVIDRVTNGKGQMSSFDPSLSDQQIADVAAYVAQSAGK